MSEALPAGGTAPAPREVQALPAELQALADGIRVAHQRIQASDTTAQRRAELSRELRRAVQVGRQQPAEGRRRLVELHATMDAGGW